MIKYLGSKRRLVPVLGAIARAVRPARALDLFTGTTRVAQELQRHGAHVTAVDSARYAHVFARTYVETDADRVDRTRLTEAIAHLDALPPRPGYFTETFCRRARFVQPRNGARVDAIRSEIAREFAGDPLEPILLTALVEATDRVDSTTGVQMAYLKEWAPRAWNRLELREPSLLPGSGRAVLADATEVGADLGHFDLAYLDPPYNQHRYTANYHVWETLVAGDEPDHYGKARKRVDLRAPGAHSPFNRRRSVEDALGATLAALDAEVVVVSCNDEGWLAVGGIEELLAPHGEVRTFAFASSRYVGARIGIHDPQGRRVGRVGRLRNVEHLVVAGPPQLVDRAATAIVALGVQRPGGSHADARAAGAAT